MVDIEHKNIPESGLHEPKGVSLASSGEVYVADGVGSGNWTPLPKSLQLIHSITGSSVSSLTITGKMNSSYNSYKVICRSMFVTGQRPVLQFSANNGTSWYSTYYVNSTAVTDGIDLNNHNNYTFDASLELINTNSGKKQVCFGRSVTTEFAPYFFDINGYLDTTVSINAIRVISKSSGSVSGTLELWGYPV